MQLSDNVGNMTTEGAMEKVQRAPFFECHIHRGGTHTNHHAHDFSRNILRCIGGENNTSMQADDCDDVERG